MTDTPTEGGMAAAVPSEVIAHLQEALAARDDEVLLLRRDVDQSARGMMQCEQVVVDVTRQRDQYKRDAEAWEADFKHLTEWANEAATDRGMCSEYDEWAQSLTFQRGTFPKRLRTFKANVYVEVTYDVGPGADEADLADRAADAINSHLSSLHGTHFAIQQVWVDDVEETE